MGSSKKHKKHKDRKHSSSNLCDESNHSFNSISNNSVISGEQGTLKLVLRVPGASNSPHMSPSIIQNQEYNNQGEMMQLGGTEGNVHSDGRPYSSSSKKMKKKKSEKKHKKHSHHHSHHHHSHHHRHKSSCSHHSSKSSSSTTNLINVLPPIPTSLVQTATSTNQLQQQPPYLMNSSSSNLDFSQDIQHQQQNVNLIDPQILPNLTSIPQQSNNQQQFSNLSNQSQSIMIDQTTSLQNTNLTSPPPPPQITSPNNCSFNSNNSNELMNNNNLYNPNVNYNMNNYGNNMMNLNEPSNNLQNTIGNLNTNINNNNMINHHLNVSPIVSPPPISTNNFITQNQTPQFTSTSETSPISANQLITVNSLNNQQTSIQHSPIQQSQIQNQIQPQIQTQIQPQIQTQIQPQIQTQIQTQIQPQPAQNQQQPCVQKSSNLNQQQQLARTPIGVKPIAKTQFQSLLGYLLKQLEKRDSQEFFFYPVTDLIAPGYSSIITKPMDFSKIRHKINLNSYENLIQFRSDVKLMCDNAMTYNRQDTIYFKAAKKLWHYARDKIFNRDSVLELVKLYQGVTNYELGLTCADYSDSEQLNVPAYDDFSHINEQMVNAQLEFMQQSKDEEPELTADQILEEVKKSAQVAADRLSLMKPKGSKYTLLRQLDDGTTSLAIVGSSINGYQEEKYVNLESLVGKLKDGSPHLPAYKESELNLAKPIEILESSPFSSYLPSSDSTKSNLTDKESALLLSTYGDDIGLSYSQSLLKFASDSDYVLTMVDSLLDALTNGQHTKVMNDLKENKESEDKMDTSLTTNEDIEMQDTNLKSDLDKKLNETTKLVTNLETIQHQRLSSSTQPIKPNKEEIKVAHLLTNKLTELIGTYTTPADITDIKSLRKCLGVKEREFF